MSISLKIRGKIIPWIRGQGVFVSLLIPFVKNKHLIEDLRLQLFGNRGQNVSLKDQNLKSGEKLVLKTEVKGEFVSMAMIVGFHHFIKKITVSLKI